MPKSVKSVEEIDPQLLAKYNIINDPCYGDNSAECKSCGRVFNREGDDPYTDAELIAGCPQDDDCPSHFEEKGIPPLTEWSLENQQSALKQGWNIAYDAHTDGGKIQHTDEFALELFKFTGEKFETDANTIEFVKAQAAQGDDLAIKALKYCGM